MSDDLISRSALKAIVESALDFQEKLYENTGDGFSKIKAGVLSEVVFIINQQPTAYDVDEKCEELVRSSYEAYGGGNHAVGLNRAINIVKGGDNNDK